MANCSWRYSSRASSFGSIPGTPMAYWLSTPFIKAFENAQALETVVQAVASGHKTADNERYIRYWYEVENGDARWVLLSKGGEFRKWYGNWLNVIDWSDEARAFYANNKTSNLMADELCFVSGITWSDISSGRFHCRFAPESVTCETVGPIISIPEKSLRNYTMALLNTTFANDVFELLAPGLHFKISDVLRIPYVHSSHQTDVSAIVEQNIKDCRNDWNAFEVSKDFARHPLV